MSPYRWPHIGRVIPLPPRREHRCNEGAIGAFPAIAKDQGYHRTSEIVSSKALEDGVKPSPFDTMLHVKDALGHAARNKASHVVAWSRTATCRGDLAAERSLVTNRT